MVSYILDLSILAISVELLIISYSSEGEAEVQIAWWCGVLWTSVWEKCDCGSADL